MADEVEMALEAVSQMFAQVKSEPTPAEAMLWAEEIERLGPRAVMAFARFWMSGGGQGDYLRAPRIMDLRRFCDPAWIDEGVAFERLRRLVSGIGPYRVPSEKDGMTPQLAEAIKIMGGWVHVCETMPDPSDEMALRAFEKRFNVAWQQAEIGLARGNINPIPLMPIQTQRLAFKEEKNVCRNGSSNGCPV